MCFELECDYHRHSIVKYQEFGMNSKVSSSSYAYFAVRSADMVIVVGFNGRIIKPVVPFKSARQTV